jgi:hypothetical protein
MAETCPIDHCDQPRKSNQLMCKSHWYKVPKELRDKIWRLARKMWNGDDDAYQEWSDARDEAIHAVEAKEDEHAAT